MSDDPNWIGDVESANIKAGDEVTLKTVSEHEAFDGTATVRAAAAPTDNYWLKIETPDDSVFVVTPATGEDHPAVLYRGRAIRATGHIPGKERIAWVDGIESVNGGDN